MFDDGNVDEKHSEETVGLETISRLQKVQHRLNVMSSHELVTIFDDPNLTIPSTLPTMVGDPEERLRPDVLVSALSEYGETILRDAEISFSEVDPHGLYLQYLHEGLRPEESSIVLLLSIITRMKPASVGSITAMLEQRKDRFSKSLVQRLSRLHSSTSGKVSHSVFSMAMEFLQVYLLYDHSMILGFTDQYKGILDAQHRAMASPGLTSVQFSRLISKILEVPTFESVSIDLLFSALQPLQWMALALSDIGSKRIHFAAQKARAFFHLSVRRRGLITPLPRNNKEDCDHPTLRPSATESSEQKVQRHLLAQEAYRLAGASPRFCCLQHQVLREGTDDYKARDVVRYCVDAWANVLLVMMAQYKSRPFGPTGSSRIEVSNIIRLERGPGEEARRDDTVSFDWRVEASHFLLDLPCSSMYQMERLLFTPVLFATILHLDGEERPCHLRLPAIACRPSFSCGRQVYQCSFPIVLPMHVLKEVLNESDLRLVVELSLRRMPLTATDSTVRFEQINSDRERAGLEPLTQEEMNDSLERDD